VLKSQPKAIHVGKKNEKHYVTVVDLKNGGAADPGSPAHMEECPYGIPGDHLWVRESWTEGWRNGSDYILFYKATHEKEVAAGIKWKPSIFMPRWASRITLEISNVRVERLQEISGKDAVKEGCAQNICEAELLHFGGYKKAQQEFEALWNSINRKKYPWASNPWVWVIEFKRFEQSHSLRSGIIRSNVFRDAENKGSL